jgi:hypothetical protein
VAKVIYKYSLAIEDFQTIQLPIGAEILCVQVQGEQPMLWAIVDDYSHRVAGGLQLKHILTVTTGGPMPTVGRYLGTYQILKGKFVGHVFLAPEG